MKGHPHMLSVVSNNQWMEITKTPVTVTDNLTVVGDDVIGVANTTQSDNMVHQPESRQVAHGNPQLAKTALKLEDYIDQGFFSAPQVKGIIYGVHVNITLDTGSTTNVISDKLFTKLMDSNGGKQKIQVITCHQIQCSTAIGAAKQRVKSQCLLHIEFPNFSFEILALVVPNLVCEAILGVDTYFQTHATLDFHTQTLSLTFAKKEYKIPFIIDSRETEPEFLTPQEKEIFDDTFFVEYIKIDQDYRVARITGDSSEILNNQASSFDQGFSQDIEDIAFLPLTREICVVNLSNANHQEVPCQPRERLEAPHSHYEKTSLHKVLAAKTDQALNLSTLQREQLFQVLWKNRDTFSDKPGLCRHYTHKLKINDTSPYGHKPRQIPLVVRDRADIEIERMIQEDIIESANSQYINPLVLVAKKDGSIRITLDARELNARCAPDHYHTETIADLLGRIRGAKFLTSWDLTSSFWQIGLHPDSRDYTAFLYNGKQYRFKRCAFGLASSGSALLRAIDIVFGNSLRNQVVNYVDDYLIINETFEDHIQSIDQVLTKLRMAGFTIKLEKSHFIKPQVDFLGYVITPEGIRMNDEKVEAIRAIPPPKNIRQLRRFLGICQYQSKFLVNYARETAPLRELLKKNHRWKWGDDQAQAFERTKELMSQAVLLEFPNENLPFIIQTDASSIGIGAILLQRDTDGNTHLLATAGRGMSKTESKMFVTELEIAAIYFALLKFRNYVYGKKIIVETDHISLSFMARCKLTSSRLARYIHEIMSQDIEIRHIPGSSNIFADLISRNPITTGKITAGNRADIVVMKVDKLSLNHVLNEMKTGQEQDATWGPLRKQSPQLSDRGEKNFAIHNGLLYKLDKAELIWKVCVPHAFEEQIIRNFHNKLGHAGRNKLILAIKEFFYIKHLAKKARQLVTKCESCLKNKQLSIRYDIEPQSIIREKPNALTAIDIHGPMPTSNFGFKYIFVMYDVFSKFVKIYPMKNINSRACLAKIVKDYIPQYGKMETVLSDNATIFSSKIWCQTLQDLGIQISKISRYHPASNPCERIIKEIGNLLRIYCNKQHKSWYKYCQIIEETLNTTINEVTRCKPIILMTGKNPEPPFKNLPKPIPVSDKEINHCEIALNRIRKRAEQRRARTKRSKHKWDVQLGEHVLVRNNQLSSLLKGQYHRLHSLFKGPYIISKVVTPLTFELKDNSNDKIIGIYHKQLLRPYPNSST